MQMCIYGILSDGVLTYERVHFNGQMMSLL